MANVRETAWHCSKIPIIPALRRLRQEGSEFKTVLNFLVKFCLKKKIK